MISNFKIGQLIRLKPWHNSAEVCLLVKYIPGRPLGKYWLWQALCGEKIIDIQGYNEYSYEIVA